MGGSSSNQHVTSLDDKKLRVKHNILLAEYFNMKAKDPYGLKEKLIEQFEKSINGDTIVGPAPSFSVPTPDKATSEEEINGINLIINALNGGKN